MKRSEKNNPLHNSAAYNAGFDRAVGRAARYNTTNLIPSITDRQEFDADWYAFMMGWNAGMQEYS